MDGPADYTIVNPGRLGWPLREAVCQQCHLGGAARVVRRGRKRADRLEAELADPSLDNLRAERPRQDLRPEAQAEERHAAFDRLVR